MRFCNALSFIVPALAALAAPLLAQTIVPDVNTLRTHVGGYGANTVIALQGYYPVVGGILASGGGMLASDLTANLCQFGVLGSTWSSGSTTIDLSGSIPTGIALGMGISGTGIQLGTIVTAFASGSPNTITISLTTTAMGNTATFSGDNGGTIFKDANNNCFRRISQTYSQVEWGAHTDGSADDTTFLQNWMNAVQPHIAAPGNSLITKPLICGYGGLTTPGVGIIQGSPPQAVGQSNTILPTFQITADNSGGGLTGSAILVMGPGAQCAIHGVGLIASSPASGSTYDTVDLEGMNELIDGHSLLSGGYYNVQTIGSFQHQENLEIYDSAFNNAVMDNLHIVTPNVKIVRNAISNAGQDDISLSTTSDALIADNNIQQAGRWAIYESGSRLVRATGNYIDASGTSFGFVGQHLGGLNVDNSSSSTFCGNTFHRNGFANEGTSLNTSHIFFSGTDDGISFCGNTYLPGPGNPNNTDIAVRPDYDYDAGPSTLLTNITIADNPAPQNKGVFGTNAAVLLGSATSPHPAQNYITGLTLSNHGASPTKLDIAPGEATDSTGTTILRNPTGCSVDLSHTGVGGLDTGTVASSTTYYVFLTGGSGGANPGCIASTSLTPSFLGISTYALPQTGNVTNGSPIVFNVGGPATGVASNLTYNPVSAMSINDPIEIAGTLPPYTITSLTSFLATVTGTTSTSSNPTWITSMNSVAGIAPNMVVGNPPLSATSPPPIGPLTIVNDVCTSAGCIPSGVMPCHPVPCVILNNMVIATISPATVTFSGNFTITLNNTGYTGSSANAVALIVYHGLYRLIGALYTTAATSPTLVSFTQDDDTFYLQSPTEDINTGGGVSGSPCQNGPLITTICALSVPCGLVAPTCGSNGIKVEAFGRIVGGLTATKQMLVSSLDQTPGLPTSFPLGTPGFSANSSATNTGFPFRLYTTTSGQVRVTFGTGAGTPSVYGITDGWVLHR